MNVVLAYFESNRIPLPNFDYQIVIIKKSFPCFYIQSLPPPPTPYVNTGNIAIGRGWFKIQ
jgi:hypothetical protein